MAARNTVGGGNLNRGATASNEIPLTLPIALPIEHHPDGAESAALLIHGYTGTPDDMRYLAERLCASGCAVSVPRLPGAGTDLGDLSSTTRRDWKRRCMDAWQDLRSRYSRVSVVGYSMGGMLALDLAARTRPDKLALLAPGIVTTVKNIHFVPLMAPFSRFLPPMKTDWSPQPDDSEQIKELGRRYWSRRDLKSAAHFVRLTGETRRILKRVNTPTLVAVSTEDHTVPTHVLEFLDQRLPQGVARSLVLKHCRHDVPQGMERETVADAVIAWLEPE